MRRAAPYVRFSSSVHRFRKPQEGVPAGSDSCAKVLHGAGFPTMEVTGRSQPCRAVTRRLVGITSAGLPAGGCRGVQRRTTMDCRSRGACRSRVRRRLGRERRQGSGLSAGRPAEIAGAENADGHAPHHLATALAQAPCGAPHLSVCLAGRRTGELARTVCHLVRPSPGRRGVQ